MPRRTASQASSSKIAAADRASRKPKRLIHRTDAEGGEALLALPRVREAPEPEQVVVPEMVNGRALTPHEGDLYVEWAEGRRAAELAMFDGLIG